LPLNVKCIFEGEEELGGSQNLESFVHRNRPALRADAAVISDTRMLGPLSRISTLATLGVWFTIRSRY
jgi:acetylornithine deacetylase/succinyl-diaminopimelate desuccinylase-like protein